MRYTPAVQPLDTGGMLETKQFTIAATGKAFRNLMDGLYSRKIEAFCREILTNAYDSHCEAGHPGRLFEVWMPTIFDKRLKVRDFGVGMDHEQVMTRYSTLFDSTKDYSDEFVGMLGLGSKSPFAYTDGFSVRCWDGQELRTYSVYLGEGGVPQISLANRIPSDEPRGVEIGIPIAKEDFAAVEKALARVCLGFAFPPKLPRSVTRRMKFDPQLHGDGWAFLEAGGDVDDDDDEEYDDEGFALEQGCYARQGCVLYPIPATVMGEVISGWISPKGMRLVIDFPMGELEVATSRESLSLTENTKAAIHARVLNFFTELGDELIVHFEKCVTDWDVARRYEELTKGGMPTLLLKTCPQREKWSKIKDLLYDALRIRKYEDPVPWRWVKIWPKHVYGTATQQRENNGLTYSVAGQSDYYGVHRTSVPNGDKELVFIVDEKTENARIAHYLKANDIGAALVLRRASKVKGVEVEFECHGATVRKTAGQITEDDLLGMTVVEELGGAPFIKASTLPAVPKLPRQASSVVTEAGQVLDDQTGKMRVVGKKELDSLASTHEALFYMRKGGVVLTPSALCTADQWKIQFAMNDVSTMISNIKTITGSYPKLIMVRVTPSTKWDTVRYFKPSRSLEDTLLTASGPDFWDDAIPAFLAERITLDRHRFFSPAYGRLLMTSANPNLRRVARLIQHDYENGKTVLRRQRRDVLSLLFERSDVIRARTVDEARARDFRVPITMPMDHFRYRYRETTDFMSPRWTKFMTRTWEAIRGVSPKEQEILYRALEDAELLIQKMGGRLK